MATRTRAPRPEDLVRYRDAIAELDIGLTTLKRLIRDGELETIYIRGRPRVLRPSISRYLKRQAAANRDRPLDF